MPEEGYTQVKGLQPSYGGYHNREYEILSQLWRSNDMIAFWQGIIAFYSFLPTDVKNAMEKNVDKVNETADRLWKQEEKKAIHFLARKIVPRRVVSIFLRQVSREILDNIMRLLDEKGYLEHGYRPLMKADFKRLREDMKS